MTVPVSSSAALCKVSISKGQRDQDILLNLILGLVPVFQVAVTTTTSKQNCLELSVATTNHSESSIVVTERNAVLRALSGVALHYALDQAPLYLLGNTLSSSDCAAATLASIQAWMSVADSMRNAKELDESFLARLDRHLSASSLLVPRVPQCTLADLDLSIVVLQKTKPDVTGAYPNLSRWLSYCCAVLTDLHKASGLVFKYASSHSKSASNNKIPIFFQGTENMEQTLEQISAMGGGRAKGPINTSASDSQRQQNTAGGTTSTNNKKQQQQPKPAKKPKTNDSATTPTADLNISALDLRVGKVIKVWHHEDSDKLFCEEIELEDGEVRQVASGLRNFYTQEEFQGRHVVVAYNLKSRKVAGFASHGMVLCASNNDQVELLAPPEGSKLGERVVFEGFDGEAEPENKVAKKKIFEKLAPDLKTDASGQVVWKGAVAKTSCGVVKASKGMGHGQVS